MQDTIKQVEAPYLHKVGKFNVGDTVQVAVKVKEGDKERIQVFQGTVIARHGGGIAETFTVRKLSGGIGVERIFPLNSPWLDSVKVTRFGRVRRSKIYFLRQKKGKKAKVPESRSFSTSKAGKKELSGKITRASEDGK